MSNFKFKNLMILRLLLYFYEKSSRALAHIKKMLYLCGLFAIKWLTTLCRFERTNKSNYNRND